MGRFIAAVLALIVVIEIGRWIYRKRHDVYITEYLFFIRFPIMMGVALLALPVGIFAAPDMFGSLFVLGWWGIFFVVFFACVCAWAIVYSAMVLVYSAPIREALSYKRGSTTINPAIPGSDGEVLKGRKAHLSALLVAPLAGALLANGSSIGWNVWAVIGGWGVAAGLREFVAWLASRRKASRSRPPAQAPRAQETATAATATAATATAATATAATATAATIAPAVQGEAPTRVAAETPDADRKKPRGTLTIPVATDEEWAQYDRLHKRARSFWYATLFVYATPGIVGGANLTTEFGAAIPALVYILAALLLLTGFLAWLSFRADKYRIPIASVVFVAVAIWQASIPSDHLYSVSRRETPAQDVRDALNDRAVRNQGNLAVVAASGGGITAALWTTSVLRAVDSLGKRVNPSFDFHRRVALVSSVSGGSVGAMYYVNAFAHDSTPSPERMKRVVEASGKSSLSAAAWGMMYPDVGRLFVGEGLRTLDRAWAQERRWRSLLDADSTPTLGTWAKDVSAGWRPIQIFNVTLEETGERMLVAPVRLASADTTGATPALWREFMKLYPDHDINVVTAARLSATFPYVTPNARPNVDRSLRSNAFHAADGGYYDNSGIVTALETISTWVNWRDYNRSARRVALIEIRASGATGDVVDKEAGSRFLHSLSGPLNTMLNVRNTSQVARNVEALGLVQRLWATDCNRPTLQHFVFRLSGNSPLSWHLTTGEATRIQEHMGPRLAASDSAARPKMAEAINQNDSTLVALVDFLSSSADARAGRCAQPAR